MYRRFTVEFLPRLLNRKRNNAPYRLRQRYMVFDKTFGEKHKELPRYSSYVPDTEVIRERTGSFLCGYMHRTSVIISQSKIFVNTISGIFYLKDF